MSRRGWASVAAKLPFFLGTRVDVIGTFTVVEVHQTVEYEVYYNLMKYEARRCYECEVIASAAGTPWRREGFEIVFGKFWGRDFFASKITAQISAR